MHLHDRVVRGDRAALEELADRLPARLRVWLRRSFRTAPQDLIRGRFGAGRPS
jgi:hypothetical protein